MSVSDHSGSKESSSEIFVTIYPPPATVGLGQKSLHSTEADKLNGTGCVGEKRSSIKEMFEQEKVKPFHYNSSIYYGAQDVYFQTETSQKPVKKDGGGGEALDGALRGNWWQGSLYY